MGNGMELRGDYLFPGKLDNTVHDITKDQLCELHRWYRAEVQENQKVTSSTYAGENYYGKYNFHMGFNREYLYRDQKTDGMQIQYPHGVILKQSGFRNYYRGENRIYTKTQPSLLRKLEKYTDPEDAELYRMVADMRIAEFAALLQEFDHVRTWDVSDVLYEALAQHYGLETGWLDITTDFEVALFFATCFWDNDTNSWKPLTKEQTEVSEESKCGMLFHMPSWYMKQRWCFEIRKFDDLSKGMTDNLIYPIGFQPFMRCSMQNGYGIYMRESRPLQKDIGFEKLRFRHSEELSKRVYDKMRGGELIYPHEGLKKVDYFIEKIRNLTGFSEEAFQYALQRNHLFRIQDKELCRKKLENFCVDGKKIHILPNRSWHIGRNRKREVDDAYRNFTVENQYGIRVMKRRVCTSEGTSDFKKMYEPYMLTDKNNTQEPGICDFKPRAMQETNNMWVITMMQELQTLMTKNARDF